MKTIIKIIFILFITKGFGQYPILSTTSLVNPTNDGNYTKKGNYAIDTNNERDQYVGLWRYETNGILFELKIEKRDQYISKIEYPGQLWYSYSDVVVFKYKLIKNGVLIYDNLNLEIPNEYNSQAIKNGQNDYLYGGFEDTTGRVCGNLTIRKLNTTTEKIFFDLSNNAYYLLEPFSSYDTSQPLFSIPTGGFEMVKVY